MSNAGCRDIAGIASIATIARSWRANPGRLKRALVRYEHNEADIEDIIQEALVEALRCIERFEGRSSLETWLFGIALNIARQHVASAAQRSRLVASLDSMMEQTPDVLDRIFESPPNADPANHAQSIQFARKLRDCVATMRPELQRTFELLCVQEYSYIEAAEALGVPVGTVRSRLHRVRSLLKASI